MAGALPVTNPASFRHQVKSMSFATSQIPARAEIANLPRWIPLSILVGVCVCLTGELFPQRESSCLYDYPNLKVGDIMPNFGVKAEKSGNKIGCS
jgi:hypothetical protein